MAKFIYIVGAQCTGKTTLCRAVYTEMKTRKGSLQIEEIIETARKILSDHQFSRQDVREGSSRCMLLQKLILESQLETETTLSGKDIVVSDRSGVDPLVYASVYGREQSMEELTGSSAWTVLRANMQRSLVVICPPVKEWLHDDGTRLMPNDWEDWLKVHDGFRSALKKYEVDFIELPLNMKALGDRVQYVLKHGRVDEI